jgi:hypothetical protein
MPNAAHQAIGRQRGVSRRPFGNNSRRNVAGMRMNGIQERSPYQAAVFASPSEPPLPVTQ